MSRLYKKREGTATQEGILGASKPYQADPRGQVLSEVGFSRNSSDNTKGGALYGGSGGEGVGAKVKQELEEPFPTSP